jgi:cell division protein FtsQ
VTYAAEGPGFRRSPAGAAALTLLAIGLGAWAVINSPVFDTRQIEVRGTRHMSEADVVDAAGVDRGDNLVRLSLDGVIDGVERLPWVAVAAADRDLPSTLVLRIVERTAVGWLEGPGGVAVVARDGVVLEFPSSPPTRLPALGEWPGPLIAGEVVPSPPDTLRVAASMDASLRRRISVATGSGSEVALELRDGGSVLYGSSTGLSQKNLELARLLRWARRRGIEVGTIDLRVPEAPTLDPETERGISPSASP